MKFQKSIVPNLTEYTRHGLLNLSYHSSNMFHAKQLSQIIIYNALLTTPVKTLHIHHSV